MVEASVAGVVVEDVDGLLPTVTTVLAVEVEDTAVVEVEVTAEAVVEDLEATVVALNTEAMVEEDTVEEVTEVTAAAGGKFVLPAHDCCQPFVPKVSPLTRYPSPRFLDILPSSFHVSLRFMPSKKIKKKKIRRFFRLSSRCSGLRTICAF